MLRKVLGGADMTDLLLVPAIVRGAFPGGGTNARAGSGAFLKAVEPAG